MKTPSGNPGEALRRSGAPGWILLIAALIGVRFLHLRPVLDGPHQWRQADTAFCALAFYRYDFNILHPSVCWRGDYRLCALEFPIHEFLTAALYRVFGPHLIIARLVTLAFFIGSVWYLYRVVRHIAGERPAWIATALYCAFPLGVVYSRAVHIDFSAVFFAHATLYYLLRTCDRPGLLDPALATVVGVFAWIVKVPYVFYLYLPLAYYALRLPWDARRLLRLTVPTLLALLAFLAWRDYSYRINAGVPDWPYVDRMVNLGEWYFGPLRQRVRSANWTLIGRRLYEEVFCRYGLILLAAGIVGVTLAPRLQRWVWWSWAGGLAVYLLIFFNLNRVHDYYQIPFLALSAVFLASGIVWLEDKLRERVPPGNKAVRAGTNTAVVAIAGALAWSSESVPGAYRVDELLQRDGAIVRAGTPENALVITSVHGQTATNMPLLLYAGDRMGWSLPAERVLEPGVLDAYKRAGAAYWVLVMPQPVPRPFVAEFGLPEPYTEHVGHNWWIHLFRFRDDVPLPPPDGRSDAPKR